MELNRKQKGKLGEDAAVVFLKQQGLQVLTQNFRCPLGEIDLVARDGETLVFVEVKSRFGNRFGLPQELVSRPKQRRLTRLAHWYLKCHRMENRPARFDVVAITWQEARPDITWIPNAFEAID